jgi:hypothetical protein
MPNRYRAGRFLVAFLVRLSLCVWVGMIVLFFIIVLSPPEFETIAFDLGVSRHLHQLQGVIRPLLTADHLK